MIFLNKHNRSMCLTTVLIFCLSFTCGAAEVFTAVEGLKEVLKVEAVVVDVLQNYIEMERQKLNILDRYVQRHKDQHEIAAKNMEAFIANPVNAYSLIKRLTVDWKQVEILVRENASEDFLLTVSLHKQNPLFPTEEDLAGAANALNRLKDTYELDTVAMARGKLDFQGGSKLTASDCFELGKHAISNDDFKHAHLWMVAADVMLKEDTDQILERVDILEYLVTVVYNRGNILLALHYTNEILQLYPEHQTALEDKIRLQEEIERDSADSKGSIQEEHVESYEDLLCRGEITIPIKISSQLKCRYVHNNNIFLLISPFKLEEIYSSPRIVMFHDVISENEITVFKNLSQHKLQRAVVFDNMELKTAEYRISKSAWLSDGDQEHVINFSKRLADMTGLSMDTAEDLQIANYGIGGYYESHYDFAQEGEEAYLPDRGDGNRIATVLVYLNPQHTVPTLVDSGFVIWESYAIITYLVQQYGKNDSLYPKNPKKRAVVDQRLYFDMGTLATSFIEYYYPIFLRNATPDPEKYSKVIEAVKLLDGFLDGHHYVAGDCLTVADVALVASVATLDVVKFDLNPYKNVSKWYGKMKIDLPHYEVVSGKEMLTKLHELYLKK